MVGHGGARVADVTALDDIAARVRACTLCPLHVARTHAVPGEGAGARGDWQSSPQAAEGRAATASRVMLVGEAPGRNEDETGRPFCGAAGKNLDLGLAAARLERAGVFVTSIVKCRPPKNRDPKPAEKATCRPYLMEQVAALRPRVLVALGRHGLSGLVAHAPKTFGSVRGRFLHASLRDPDGGILPVFCSLHPAAVIYRQAWKQQYLDDWAWFGDWLRSGAGVPAERAGPRPID